MRDVASSDPDVIFSWGIGVFDLIVIRAGSMELVGWDPLELLRVEKEYGTGHVMGLTHRWHRNKHDVVGIVVHIFDGDLFMCHTEIGLRMFARHGNVNFQNGRSMEVLRVGMRDGEII